jgi:hypothetical protein
MSEVLCVIPSRERAESGTHSTADNLGAQAVQSLVRLQRHPLLPKKQAKKGVFHAVLQKAVARRVDRVPLADGPFPRLLLVVRNVVAADLRRATILVDELPKLHLRHI